MTRNQQVKLQKMIDRWCEKLDADITYWLNSSQKYSNYILDTAIGRLSISVCKNGVIACRFANIRPAIQEYYGGKPLHECQEEFQKEACKFGLLDPTDAVILFRFGEITAQEAFDQIRNTFDRVLK